MSKKNTFSAPRRKKQGSLIYQIKHSELERKEKKDTPMLKKTENQYKKARAQICRILQGNISM